jgi:hypothetical protein
MIRTDPLYEICQHFFAEYAPAAEAIDENGLIRSLVLLLPDGDSARFFVLVANHTKDRVSYSVFPWRADGAVEIRPDADSVPEVFATVLREGVPLPRDGSLFGWARMKAVTAMIGVRTRYTPASPAPSWAVLPLVGRPAGEWPPFTGERLFGPWFWDHYRAGTIVPLDDLIAGTSGSVFWVDAKDLSVSECCAVARDLRSAAGFTLRRGCYVHYQALRSGKPVPPLAQLLTSPSKTDLGPRFHLARRRTIGYGSFGAASEVTSGCS